MKLHDTVASKRDSSITGVLTRIKRGTAYVMPPGASEAITLPVADLVKVKRARPAKASAPSPDTAIDIPISLRRGPSKLPTTKKIQVKLAGTLRGKMFQTIERSFETVEKAKEYLGEFKLAGVNGQIASVQPPAEASLRTNYPIADILAGKAPSDELPVIFVASPSQRVPTMPARPITATSVAAEGNPVRQPRPRKAVKAVVASDLTPLKAICQELSCDPREARIALRSLSRKGKLAHEPSGRWEWPSSQVAEITAQLKAALGKDAGKAIEAAQKHLGSGEKPAAEMTKKVLKETAKKKAETLSKPSKAPKRPAAKKSKR